MVVQKTQRYFRIIDQDGKKELIRRLPKANNKKSIVIQLTDEGKKVSEEAYSGGTKFVNKTMSSLSGEERHQLWITLRKQRNLALK